MADGGLATADPRPEKVLRYRVEGMDCPSCSGKIETAVTRLGGASDVKVNYHRQTLALRLDEERTPRTALEEQVRRLGYGIKSAEALQAIAGAESRPVAVQAVPRWRGTLRDR